MTTTQPPVDVDGIRETVESGEVTKHRAEDQLTALCDEVEHLRAELARSRQAHTDEVAEILAETDAETDRLTAENTLLGEALDEAVSDNTILVGAFRARREVVAICDELEETCLRYGIDPDADLEPDPEADRAHAAADKAIDADDEISKAYDLIQERIRGHIRAAYDANREAA